MKIVVITKENKNVHSGRINLDFIKKLKPYCDEFHVVPVYNGKDKKVFFPAKKVYKKYKPDIMICHAQTPLLDGYFKNVKCMKVIVAVDFYKIIKGKRFSFYKNNKFDLMIYRNCLHKEERDYIKIPNVWLPWSADENIFRPKKQFNNKMSKIGFSGKYAPKNIYYQRNKAINLLKNNNLLKNYGKVGYKKYPKVLRSHLSMLTSAEDLLSLGRPGYTFAKLFEIMASGSIPLIPPFKEEKIFFKDKPKAFVKYASDVSDIVEKAKFISLNRNLMKEMSYNAYKIFAEKHTDTMRIHEFCQYLKEFYNTGKITEIWENID